MLKRIGRNNRALKLAVLILGLGLVTLISQARQLTIRNPYLPNPVLRVAYGFDPETLRLDPRDLVSAVQREIADNIFGRLVRTDESGQIISDLPEGFTAYGNRVTFSFANHPKTSSGKIVGAQDAALSLKRLLARPGHSDLARFLCEGKSLRSLSDECEGIVLNGDKLILEVDKQSELPLLIAALDSADYSILPSSVIREDGELRGSSLKDTTGPYFVDKIARREIALRANHLSSHFTRLMPQIIELKAMESEDAISAFSSRKIDILPPTTYWPVESGRDVIEGSSRVVYETIPSKVLYALFSEKALKDFSANQRLYLGLRIAKAYQKVYPQVSGSPTSEYLQPVGVGGLNADELHELEAARIVASTTSLSRTMTFGVPQEQYVRLSRELSDLTQVKLVPFDTHPCNLEREFWPDVMMMATDSAATENLALTNHDLQLNLVASMGAKSKFILREGDVDGKPERIERLRKLHFDDLMQARIVPVEVSPFFAVSRSGWKFHQTKLRATMSYWSLRPD